MILTLGIVLVLADRDLMFPNMPPPVTFGILSFSPAPICFSALINVLVFSLRNLFQLFKESQTLVIMDSNMAYARVRQSYLDYEANVVAERAQSHLDRRMGSRRRWIRKLWEITPTDQELVVMSFRK